MAKRPLFWQLFPSYLFVLLLALTAASWFVVLSLKQFYFKHQAQELQARAVLVRAQLTPYDFESDASAIDSLCKQLGNESTTRITVVRPSGTVVGDTDEDPMAMENHAGRPEIQEAFAGRTGVATRFSHTLRRTMMYVAVPVTSDNRVTGVVRMALPVTQIEHTFGSVYTHVAVGLLLIASLAGIASLFISRRLARPLARMTSATEHFARGEFAYRLPPGSSLETDKLAQTMNLMASQLDEKIRAITDQRR